MRKLFVLFVLGILTSCGSSYQLSTHNHTPEYIGDGTDEDILEPFAITEKVMIELLKNTEQPEILNVRVLKNPNDEDEGKDYDGSIDTVDEINSFFSSNK